jgi:UDPglucose 6-dehydrogenase
MTSLAAPSAVLAHARVEHPVDLCVVGAGYVGLTAAACFADLGHRVRCLEANPARLQLLQGGGIPIVEPGLDELVARSMGEGRLSFTGDVVEAMGEASIVFLCVGTPPRPDGTPDLGQLERAARDVVAASDRDLVLVTKSTVPPGTGEALEILCAEAAAPGQRISVVSNPEFLRESRAVEDFFHPDRIVVGTEDADAGMRVAALYEPGPPVVISDRRGAELVKYASNAFLAVKISFANEIAGLCERLGTDAGPVLRGVGLDGRIGTQFLSQGPGYGGSCLPKDLSGLIAVGEAVGHDAPLASAAEAINARARRSVVDKLETALGSLAGARVGVLGLAFKPGTDDTRDSPAVELVRLLTERGAEVRAHDPLAAPLPLPALRVDDPLDLARDADALVVATGWSAYADLDPAVLGDLMARRIVLDAVNVLPAADWRDAGFVVYGVGRGAPTSFHPVVWAPILWALRSRATAPEMPLRA